MADNAALLFRRPPASDGALVFGAGANAPDVPPVIARVVGRLPALTVGVRARYLSDTSRPLASEIRVRFQDGDPQLTPTRERWQNSTHLTAATTVRSQAGERVRAGAAQAWRDAARLGRDGVVTRYQQAIKTATAARSRFRQAQRAGQGLAVVYEDALQQRTAARSRFQDATRGLGGQLRARYQDATRQAWRVRSIARDGMPQRGAWSTRYEDAIAPPPGVSDFGTTPPVVVPPCYTPNPALVFRRPWVASPALRFTCRSPTDPTVPGATVVIPVQRIYAVINSAILRRVDGNVPIPTLSMSLSIDVDSWTWGFTARGIPGSALEALEPSGAGPVELEAIINGVPYRALVESLARERSFGRNELTVSGRGKAALLDAPYVPAQTFSNAGAPRTAQQLAASVLTFNGVPIGWDVDAGWQVEDWLVPAGAWSHQGTYISALNAIASAAGGYLQPHRVSQALSVLPRYPVAPWQWGEVTPDYELPADVVSREGITWSDQPQYNRVFVRGGDVGGVLGNVVRRGTAGDIEAPQVVDNLITTAAAARQRALPVLANVGRQAAVSLRLPVLSSTGIIPPGKFVRYRDGGTTRIGLTRSVSVASERADKTLTVWQTLGVETHVS